MWASALFLAGICTVSCPEGGQSCLLPTKLFGMGNEKNIPTAFTVFLLSLNSFVTAMVWLRASGDFRA